MLLLPGITSLLPPRHLQEVLIEAAIVTLLRNSLLSIFGFINLHTRYLLLRKTFLSSLLTPCLPPSFNSTAEGGMLGASQSSQNHDMENEDGDQWMSMRTSPSNVKPAAGRCLSLACLLARLLNQPRSFSPSQIFLSFSTALNLPTEHHLCLPSARPYGRSLHVLPLVHVLSHRARTNFVAAGSQKGLQPACTRLDSSSS